MLCSEERDGLLIMKRRVAAYVMLLMLLLSAMPCIAAESELNIKAAADNELGAITVTGSAPASWGRRKISVMVCKPAQDAEIDFVSMDEASFLEHVYTICETECNADGNFSMKIVLADGADSGYYWVRAGASGVANSEANDKRVLFVERKTAEKVLVQVNEAKSADELQKVLEGTASPENLPNCEILSLDLEDEIYAANALTFCEYLFAKRGNGYRKVSDLQNMFTVCRALTDLTICTEDEVKVKLASYASLLGADITCKEYLQNSDAIAKLIKTNIKTLIQYSDDTGKFFRAMTAVTAINVADRSNVMNVVKKYAESLDITLGTEYESLDSYEVGKALVGKNFFNVHSVRDALSARIEELLAEKKKNDKTSSGGGSSGGSKGSGLGIDTPAPITPIEQKDAEALESLFSDVAREHWAYESIAVLTEKGVLSGMGDGTFSPDETITREQLAKIISAAFSVTQKGEMPFEDVRQSAWYAPFVESVYAAGIVKGVSEAEFGVGKSVTRQDFMLMLYRILQSRDVIMNPQEPTFYDTADIADYAREAIGALAEIGAVKGTNERKVEPRRAVSRAEAAKLIYDAVLLTEQRMGVE